LRIAMRYNRKSNRSGVGTIWTDRFRSHLLDEDWRVLATVASYIDLKAVGKGLVAAPKDYPWCGYAAAAAGDKRALEGLSHILGDHATELGQRKDVVTMYEAMLMGHELSIA